MKDNDLISRQSLLNSLNRFAPEHFNALVNDLIMKEPAASFPQAHENDHIAEVSKMDTISRQAAIDAIESHIRTAEEPYQLSRADEVMNHAFEIAASCAYNLPSAQPERTGRWILHENQRQEDVDNGNYLYICSECGKSDIHAKTQDVPFCWWCGAKMEEEHE